MRSLVSIIGEKKIKKKRVLDDKTVFFIFSSVIEKEYGRRGIANIKPVFYKNGKIFLHIEQSVWVNEILMQKDSIIQQLNDIIGNKEIVSIVLSRK